MPEIIENRDFLSLLSETFSRGGTLNFTPHGTSMRPLLNGTSDLVTLEKAPADLKKYDVVLYRRDNGTLVLHRIVRCDDDGSFTMMGDNQITLEKGIRRDQISARMCAYKKGEREYTLSAASYRFYCRAHLFRQLIKRRLSIIYHRLMK